MKYPTLDEVNKATIEDVFMWYIMLPAPKTDVEVDVIERVALRYDGCRTMNGEVVP